MNQKGISHHLALIALAVITVVGAAGFFVYRSNSTNALYISELGCHSTPTLRQGSSGNCVKAVQNRINNTQCFGSIAVDGKFGPVTKGKVQEYQRKAGLGVDGVVGPQTWGNLLVGTPGKPVSCHLDK